MIFAGMLMCCYAVLFVRDIDDALERVAGMTLLRRAQLSMRHLGAEYVLLLSLTPDSPDEIEGFLSSMRSNSALIEQGIDGVITYDKWLELLDFQPSATWLLGHADHVYDKRWKELVQGDADAMPANAALQKAFGYELLEAFDRSDDAWRSLVPTGTSEHTPFTADASQEGGKHHATERLWDSCRKDIDGLISRHLNRHISLAISRRLVDTRIHPNTITVLNMLVGLLSGWFALQGDYRSVLIGAMLLQANSIFDGIDGELARVRWQFSKFGARFDYLGDNLANFSFFGALCVAMYRNGEVELAKIGALCLVMWVGYVAHQYTQLFITEKGSPLELRLGIEDHATGWFKSIIDLLRSVVLRRDGFVFMILVLAALDLHGPLIIMMCLGAAIPFFGMLMHYPIKLYSAAKNRSE